MSASRAELLPACLHPDRPALPAEPGQARAATVALAALLSAEDQQVRSMSGSTFSRFCGTRRSRSTELTPISIAGSCGMPLRPASITWIVYALPNAVLTAINPGGIYRWFIARK